MRVGSGGVTLLEIRDEPADEGVPQAEAEQMQLDGRCCPSAVIPCSQAWT